MFVDSLVSSKWFSFHISSFHMEHFLRPLCHWYAMHSYVLCNTFVLSTHTFINMMNVQANMHRDCAWAMEAFCSTISFHRNESIQEYNMPTLHMHIRIDNCFKEQQQKWKKGGWFGINISWSGFGVPLYEPHMYYK